MHDDILPSIPSYYLEDRNHTLYNVNATAKLQRDSLTSVHVAATQNSRHRVTELHKVKVSCIHIRLPQQVQKSGPYVLIRDGQNAASRLKYASTWYMYTTAAAQFAMYIMP